MFRHWLSLFLIVGLTQISLPSLEAQSAESLSPIPQSAPLDGKIDAKVYPNYDALRRGAEMKVAVVPFRPGHGPSFGALPIFLRRASSLAPESISTRLEFDPLEGLSLSIVEPTHSKATKFSFSTQPVQVLTPAFKNHPVAFRVKITASQSVPLGAYVLHGRLTYREVDDRGISDPWVIPVEIPIHVVERDTKVKKDRYWTFDQSQAKETTTLVLLSPVLIPAAALMGAVCLLSLSLGNHCTD